MKLETFILDAFATKSFEGNPAAVCILNEPGWLPENLLQMIAAENNQSETAFVLRDEDGNHLIRWFTPTIEVDLCGHATLAAAYVLFEYYYLPPGDFLIFHSHRSGQISAYRNQDNKITIDFPIDQPNEVNTPEAVIQGIGVSPIRTFKGKTDYMAWLSSPEEVETIKPNLQWIASLKARGLIVTAKGIYSDFVYRFFAPQSGINEDPATGSALTLLAPFWGSKLGKLNLSARQFSLRKGFLDCQLKKDRIEISGYVFTYLTGNIEL